MKLTVEEIHLLCMMDTADRENAMKELRELSLQAENEELQEICIQTVRKLEKMDDEEFAGYDFAIYKEGFETE